MKSHKTMLLGIALILFGIACKTQIFGFISIEHFEEMVEIAAAGLCLIGIIVVLIGYSSKDNLQKK